MLPWMRHSSSHVGDRAMWSRGPVGLARSSTGARHSTSTTLSKPIPMWNVLRWLIGRPSASNKVAIPFLSTDTQYEPPAWAQGLSLVPKERLGLGVLPTPVHPWHIPGLPPQVKVFIKRDDLTGMQLSGNKVRKLEFLIAEAKRNGHDCVVTIGGIQSNHCRATAVAARYAGLDTHLLLRTSRALVEDDPGLVGNLLVDRMVGAHIHLVTKEEYTRHGSSALGAALVEQLRKAGKNPYLIPVGGSNALGTWGYLQAVEEIRQQCSDLGLTDIVMACGSGGTTAGLALGVFLAGLKVQVHAYGVCDTPDWFYNHIDELMEELGVGQLQDARAARGLLRAVQARGLGYAMSSDEELQTIKAVSESTGVLLDPVYSGKAVHGMLQEMQAQPEAWKGRRVLFIHTGGLLGMYDKCDHLESLLVGKAASPAAAPAPAGPAADHPLASSPAQGSQDDTASTTKYGAKVHRFVLPG